MIKIVNPQLQYTRTVLVFVFLFFIVDPAIGTTYHVASIEEANSVGAPGDTIYIAPGTYTKTLRPLTNGEPGKYLTFISGGDDVIFTAVSKGINLNGRSYIHIKGFKFIKTNGPWIDMTVASPNHIIIEDCYMYMAYTWSGISMLGASYVKILNNVLISHCPCTKFCIGSGSGGPHDLIEVYNSHHNLIEGNEFYDGIHTSLGIQDSYKGATSWNIIRNNYFSNVLHSNIGIWGVEYILVENNVVVDGGENHYQNYCSRSTRDVDMERHKHKGIMINTENGIVRNNVAVNNGGGLMIASAISDTQYPWKCNAVENYLYNNTLVENTRGVSHNSTDPAIDNVLKNNIIYNSTDYNVFIYDGSGTPSTNHFIHNNIIGTRTKCSTQDELVDNLSLEPDFVNAESRDYRLLAGSPMIDAATWLTTTSNSGTNSKIMEVEDARYFMDGWGLIEGDQIQLEGHSTLIIIDSVDYSNNTLTLEEEFSWEAGVGVSLPYNGSKPDLGSWESSSIPLKNYTVDSTCVAAYLMIGESFERDRSGHNTQLEMSGEEIPRIEDTPVGFDGYSRKFISGNVLLHTDGLSTDISGINQSISWSMWVYFNETPENDTYLMGKYTAPLDKQYLVYYDKSNQNFAWLLSGDGVNTTVCSGKTAVINGEWIHLAGVFNADTEQMELFVNAISDSSQTNPVSHNSEIFNGNSDFIVGDFSSSATFSGSIDEVTIFKRAISPEEINGIYLYGLNGVSGALDQQIITSVIPVEKTEGINIYPNPVDNKINICGDPTAKNINVRIFNINGTEVFKSIENQLPVEINTNGFLKGMYIVNVLFENGYSYVSKIIKI